MKTIVAELEFAVDTDGEGRKLIGIWPRGGYRMYLGAAKIAGTLTAALRQFNLPTARAPGDWPEPTTHTARY